MKRKRKSATERVAPSPGLWLFHFVAAATETVTTTAQFHDPRPTGALFHLCLSFLSTFFVPSRSWHRSTTRTEAERTHCRNRARSGDAFDAARPWKVRFPARRSANGLITSPDIFLDIARSEWNRAGPTRPCTFRPVVIVRYLIRIFIVNNKRSYIHGQAREHAIIQRRDRSSNDVFLLKSSRTNRRNSRYTDRRELSVSTVRCEFLKSADFKMEYLLIEF